MNAYDRYLDSVRGHPIGYPRGRGITTNQILTAPPYSIYLWLNERIDYPQSIARKYNRTDIVFIPYRRFMSDMHSKKIELNDPIIIDHSCFEHPDLMHPHPRIHIEKQRRYHEPRW